MQIERSIVWLARLDPSVAALVHYIAERETQGVHRQKMYAEAFEAMFCLAMEQISETAAHS